MDIKKLITDQFEEMAAFRRDLHEHAEPSGNEVRTAARISEELEKSGIEHTVTPYHAVIATIHGGKGQGKTVALRGGIDALSSCCFSPPRRAAGAPHRLLPTGF